MTRDNMLVCPEPEAAEAGREVFAAGGNAVDAAVAAAFVQGVTNPLMTGIGGTGVIYYYDSARRERRVLNCEVAVGSRPVPARWVEEYVGRSETIGRYILRSEANQVGFGSVMIPGFVRGCWVAWQRFGSGRVPWADLLAPATRLAREGFDLLPYVADSWHSDENRPGYPGLMAKMAATPDAARIYLKPGGALFATGDRLVQAELANTLQRLAEAGGDDFYTGEIARAIAADMARHEGFITPEDLRDYAVEEQQPLSGRFRGLEVTAAPYPSAGAQLIEILQIMEHFDLAGIGHNTPEYLDLVARAQRAAFADNVGIKGLSLEAAGPLERETTDPARAAAWAERLRRGDRVAVQGGAVAAGTTHLTAVDADRNVVCFTHSIGSIAGSGAITPGLGFLYNNFLGHFNPLPGRPDSIAPGKRIGGVVPTIVYRDGTPVIGIGAPGGSRLLTSVAQALLNAVAFDLPMQTAVSVPRCHSEEAQIVFIEPAFPETTAEALRALGNDVRRSTYMSRVQAVRIPADGPLEAGADPRGGMGVGVYP